MRNALGNFIIVQTPECTYTDLNGITYCTPRLYYIAYCTQTNPYSKSVTILNTLLNTVLLLDHCRICGQLLAEMSLCVRWNRNKFSSNSLPISQT